MLRFHFQLIHSNYSPSAERRVEGGVSQIELAMSETDGIVSKSDYASAYDTLMVEPTCSMSELKASYKRLILLHHPDRGIESGASFIRIQAAWKLVASAEERKSYDMTSNSGVFGSSESFTISDFICDGDKLSKACRCGDFYEV